MEKSEKYNLFNAFLQKEMNEEQLAGFKKELENNPELKKEFLVYLLNASDGMKVINPELRALVKEVYSETKSSEFQMPSRGYVIKRFAQDNWPRVAVAAGLVFAILYSISHFLAPADYSELKFAELMSEPISMERASVNDVQNYQQASYYYFQDKPLTDSLEAMADTCRTFCVGRYYLAHAYLKSEQFEKALDQFEICLKYLDQLNKVPQLQGSDAEIHFNLILTKLAINKDPLAAKKALGTLKEALNPNNTLNKKIETALQQL